MKTYTIKILLLEDNPDDAHFIMATLKRAGLNIEIKEVSDEDGFINALDAFVPDIILSDHQLPQFTSDQALKIARQKMPHVPFILVTGTVSEEFAASIIKAGADDYILKDRLIRLPAAIEAALKQRLAEKERIQAEKKLIESEEQYRAIMERVSDAFVALDKNWCYTYVNKAAGKIMHRKPNELIGKYIWAEFPEDTGNAFHQAYYLAMERQKYIYLEEYYPSFNSWLENHIYPSPQGISIFFRDITERKKAELQKEFDGNNLKALINNTNDLMWSVDTAFNLITSNDAFDKIVELMSGKKIEKGSNLLVNDFAEIQINQFRQYYQRAFNGESFSDVFHNEAPVDVWSEISFYPIQKKNEVIGTACFSRDITERKNAEEALKLMEQEIMEQRIQEQKKTARAIIEALEKERNHIGQELHDNINQILVGSKMYLSSAVKKDEALKQLVKYPIELIDSSIEEIRLLCSNIVTPVKNINLKELVQRLMGNLNQNAAIETSLIYAIEVNSIPDDLKLNIYRILQEQVNNILKHAEAKNVAVSIIKENNAICVTISDDGKGFDNDRKKKGIGILNMANRIDAFNGNMEIVSSIGNGCTISIVVPY
jgi:PAS domain S-box-containing protein